MNSAQADLTVKDKDLNTPLHLAISKVCNGFKSLLLIVAIGTIAPGTSGHHWDLHSTHGFYLAGHFSAYCQLHIKMKGEKKGAMQ